MRCPECGTAMRRRKEQQYKYRESGLENVVIVVAVRACPKCGEALPEIPNVRGLHAAIADRLCQKPTPLTGGEVRFLRKEMGVKARELANSLGVNPVTVSRWETGAERVGDITDRLVRCLYLFHRIQAGREVRPAESFQRIREGLSQIKRVRRPRPLPIVIPGEVAITAKAGRRHSA